MRERGFTIWLYLLLLAFVAAAGGGIVWKYNSAIERAQAAEAQVAETKVVAEKWQKTAEKRQGDFDASERIAQERLRQNQALLDRLQRFDQRLADLARRSPGAAAFLTLSVDLDVRRVRRINAGCSADLAVQCTPLDVVPDAAAAAGRRDSRAALEGERVGARGASAGEPRQSGREEIHPGTMQVNSSSAPSGGWLLEGDGPRRSKPPTAGSRPGSWLVASTYTEMK